MSTVQCSAGSGSLCFCFVWAHSFCLSFLCAVCSHVNCLDPTHLVTWLLVNLPHLSFLVTLLICSLYGLLVFAVLCQFAIACILSCPVLSALSCRAKAASCLVFPYGVVLVCCCFFVVVLNKSPSLCTIESSPHPFIPSSLTLTSPFFYIGWL